MGKYERDADAVLEKKGVAPSDPLILPLIGPGATKLYYEIYETVSKDNPSETVADNQRTAIDKTFRQLQIVKAEEWREDYKRDGYVFIFSPLFKEQIYLARDRQAFNKLNNTQGCKVYMERELKRLKGINQDELKCLHWAKELKGEIL